MDEFLFGAVTLVIIAVYAFIANWFLKKSIASIKKRYIISAISGIILTAVTYFFFFLFILTRVGGC